MAIDRAMKICEAGNQSKRPDALFHDGSFADEFIDANLRLLLKIIVYLRNRSGWNSAVALELESAPRVPRGRILVHQALSSSAEA